MAHEELRDVIQRYRTVDDQLHALNRQVMELRATRKEVETQIIEIVRQPEYAEVQKMNISADNSVIHIKRPGTWCAPVSLSQQKIIQFINEYFDITPAAEYNGGGCAGFVLMAAKRGLVGNTFKIERSIPF